MARQPADKSQESKIDDSALIRELALLLDETNLTEIEIERAGLRVRVARNISMAVATSSPAAATVMSVSATPVAGAELGKHPRRVPSPLGGTGDLASQPRANPVIQGGAH